MFGSLDRAAELIQSAGITGPALLVIGEVVALAKDAPQAVRSETQAGKAKPSLSDLWRMFT